MTVSYKYGEGGSQNQDRAWWHLPERDVPESVSAILHALSQHQTQRLSQHMISARLYGNLPPTGVFSAGAFMARSKVGIQNVFRDRITYNVVQSAIDTVTSKIAKNKPKPLFLTSGGDYKIQRKAKKLSQFVEGVFYENNAHSLGQDVFRDACVFGTGAIKVFDQDGRVKFERTLTSELFVDDIEAFYGEPRQLHHVRNIDRGVLYAAFGPRSTVVKDAPAAKLYESENYPIVSDQVTVRESWHLPSSRGASDGRHVISVGNGVLLSEPWEKPFFPFVFFHWTKRLNGFWGQGLAEQVQNIQLEVNKLLWLVQRSMHLAGTFKIFIENTAKIVKEHLNNDIGTIISYSGNTPPQYVVPPIVPPEVYQHLQTLKNAAYEQAGISVLSAQGKKPEGLNSGKALRAMNDIESDRFMTIGQGYEQLFLDLGKLAVATIKDITEEGKKSYEVKIPGKKFLDTVDWKEVKLEEDQYVLKVYPISSLPNDPAGRLQTIQEYVSAGFLDAQQGRRLLDFPDLDRIEDLANAEEEYLSLILDKMVDEGVFTPPESFDDLTRAQKMALQYYAQGKSQGVEEEKLDLLRRFIAACQKMLAPPPPPPMAMPVGAGAGPAMPPGPQMPMPAPNGAPLPV
jgi:hypothetical protein